VKFKGFLTTTCAIVFGALVLAGTLFGHNADGTLSLLGELQQLILNVAVILAGFAVLVGILNLLLVHLKKVRLKQKGAGYSIILIVTLVATFLLGLLAHYIPMAASLFSDTFQFIQLPVEKSLMALLERSYSPMDDSHPGCCRCAWHPAWCGSRHAYDRPANSLRL
jgi:nitrate reductase gamma subunit